MKVSPWRERPEVMPIDQRAKVAQVVLGLTLAASVFALFSDIEQYGIVGRFADGEVVRQSEIAGVQDRAITATLIFLATVLVTAIAFLLWWGRAYRNIVALGVRDPRYGRRWALWYWFIPIVAFFRPKQVTNDIWRGSDPDLNDAAGGWRWGSIPPVLNWWWAAWIGSGVVEVFARQSLGAAYRDSPFTPDFDVLTTAATAYVASDVLSIAGAALAIVVVRRITSRQQERIDRHERGEIDESAPPGPRPGDPPPVAASI